METDEKMILKDMPVDTRNYSIIDNVTGKPINQDNYTLTLDPEVISKLNQLKKMNEEKIKQAALKDQYGDSSLVSTFTPENNSVFTPQSRDEYINYFDFNPEGQKKQEEVVEEIVEEPDIPQGPAQTFTSDTLLNRVTARSPSARLAETEVVNQVEEVKQPELDYISTYDPNQTNDWGNANQPTNEEALQPTDNSIFNPENATFQEASEQIVKIDTSKLGQDIKSNTERTSHFDNINLDKMEIISGKGIAWFAYLLFFIPLLFKKNNRFVRIHANEGLELNIMEILAGLLVGQYFLIPEIMEKVGNTLHWISLAACLIGVGLAATCIVTIVIMMIASMCGKYFQNPWLWKRRIIKVPSERTSD